MALLLFSFHQHGGASAERAEQPLWPVAEEQSSDFWSSIFQEAEQIVSALLLLQNDKISDLIPSQLKTLSPEEWTMLPGFVFSDTELSEKSDVDFETTKSLLESFVCPTDIDMNQFSALDDFNPLNAYENAL